MSHSNEKKLVSRPERDIARANCSSVNQNGMLSTKRLINNRKLALAPAIRRTYVPVKQITFEPTQVTANKSAFGLGLAALATLLTSYFLSEESEAATVPIQGNDRLFFFLILN